MDVMIQDEKNDERKSKPDAMTQGERKNERKSKVDISIERLDAIFIEAGLPKPEWLDPEPNRHRVIIRFQGKKKD